MTSKDRKKNFSQEDMYKLQAYDTDKPEFLCSYLESLRIIVN